jgi:amino acid adenylation domain-containing protein
VRAVFNVELPLRSLFDSSTIAALASVIETALKTGAATEMVPIPRVSRRGDVALSFAQQRLWFVQQMEPDNPFYNVTAAVRARGTLDLAALERSFNHLLERHEVLRTSFTVRDGQPVGVVAGKVSIDLPIEDLSNWDEPRREAELVKLCVDAAHQPFDLTHVPLLRTRVLRLSRTDHVIVVVMHHLISDAWSAEILIREMTALYEANTRGAAADLPELHIQYADYAAWQQNWLKDDVLDAQLAYWKRQLEGVPALLELPTDYSRPAAQTFRGAGQYRRLPRELSAALKELSRAEGVTLFMTLLTAFDILLSRYSGQKDIAVGSTIANRTRAETEGLIGFFVNTLILRADLSGDPTFQGLLRQVRETSLMAFTHQDLPFEMLVKELSPVRSLSHTPLFQVTFDLNSMPPEGRSLPELSLTSIALEDRASKFDLSMTVTDSEDGLETFLQYSVDLFEPGTIRRMLENFEVLLESIVRNPGAPYSTLTLLSGPERERILVEWNETRAEYPQGECLHSLFERQAEARHEALAVVCGNEHVTFAELNRRSNQLARYLQRLGARPEVPIGIYLERSTEMCVALLAVLKAGATYLPLDPAYPKDRIAFMLADARPPILLAQQRFCAQLPVHEARQVNIDTEWEQIARESEQRLLTAVAPENSAYLIYTSGSTGKPKGVLSTHAALVNYALAAMREFRLTPDDCFLQFAPLSFDVLVEELFPAWLSGARVAIPNERVLSSFPAFLDFIDQEQITLFEAPASFWHQWVQELNSKNVSLPSSLRLVIAGCEKMSPKYLDQWQKFRVPMIHIYGLTETTVTSMLHQLPATLGERDFSNAPPVGRPIANIQAYLLDTRGQPVPVGAFGEIYIGGEGVGRGYLGHPELTAERFIPDPFGNKSGERFYRTGDIGRYRSDGSIEFLRRLDEQVKIRGFRIEPGEIEAALALHPSVVDAVVVAREDRPGDKRLVAYIVPNGQQPAPTAGALHEHLKQILPDYMIPSAFVMLEALPLTSSGKVDRRALPAPDRNGFQAEGQFVAPRTPVEQTLADIWAEVLGLESISIHDNFFHLGGHSLLAIQIVSRVRDAFQADLPLRKIFETPTIAGLSIGIVQTQAEDLNGEQAAEILARLESLSAAEIQMLLAE